MDGVFLIGILLISLLSATILLFLPDEKQSDLIPIFKLMMAIWILRAMLVFLGYRFE